ncbi:hypothetical protein M5D96_001346, partial [Drosophila gunungcola]
MCAYKAGRIQLTLTFKILCQTDFTNLCCAHKKQTIIIILQIIWKE